MAQESATLVEVKDTLANPAPLGLLGFGMTTVLLNLHNAGFYTLDSMILAMGIFYGGLAQILAGIMEWKKGNTFGTTAFTSYGLFWLSLVALIVMPNLGLIEPPTPSAMAAYLIMWGIFTAVMNVGSLYDMPPDTFWTLIYEHCKVPEDRVFPMETHVDAKTIRPYFNAGILVTRPDKHLLRSWRDTFFSVYQKPKLQELYLKDERYTIFIHQAILSGVILQMFSQDEMQNLPNTYNYPIRLYEEDITEHRPSSVEDLVTFRHEGFCADPDWMKKMPAGETLKNWLAKRLPGH